MMTTSMSRSGTKPHSSIGTPSGSRIIALALFTGSNSQQCLDPYQGTGPSSIYLRNELELAQFFGPAHLLCCNLIVFFFKIINFKSEYLASELTIHEGAAPGGISPGSWSFQVTYI